MNWLALIVIIAVLIFFSALYVAAEFSTVSARRSRLSQLAAENNRLAKTLLTIVEDRQLLDRYVATCQIGITLSNLLIGYFGQQQLTALIRPWFINLGSLSEIAAQSISATSTLLVLTILQVLIGELVPKNIGIQYPESLAMLTLGPMRWSMTVFRPLIWFFNGSGEFLLRLFRMDMMGEHAHIHSPGEIMMLVEESGQGGVLRKEEQRLLKNTLELREAKVREVMIPRPYMLSAPGSLGTNELFAAIVNSPYSRLPIYEGSIDNIVGVVHLKDLLCLEDDSVEKIVKPVPLIPETTPVRTVFSLLQRRHLQVAIVLDEFGGTAGMVTLEDLIEEIFGELQDEFDTVIPTVRVLSDEWVWIRGDTLIADLNEWFDLHLPEEDADTIGGLVLYQFDRVPSLGEAVNVGGQVFEVEKMRGRGVTAVRMRAAPGIIQRLREGEA
jgi:CBS domain containing-hemolysin-like protein